MGAFMGYPFCNIVYKFTVKEILFIEKYLVMCVTQGCDNFLESY
jgi:hypothetical protein